MFRRLFIAATFLLCTSCATVLQGTKEEINFASDPSGAYTTVSDASNGYTPYSLHIDRDQNLQVHFSKPGYQSYYVVDNSHISWGYFWTDAVFTLFIGDIIDAADGALFYHENQMVDAHLEPLATPSPTPVPKATGTPAVPLIINPPPLIPSYNPKE